MIEIEIGPTEPYSDEVIRDIGIVLELNKEALDLIHASTHLEKYRPEIPDIWEGDQLPLLSHLRASARLLAEQATYRAQTEDIDGAIDSIATIFWSTKMFRQYPDLISLMVVNAVDGIAVASIGELVNRNNVSDAQLSMLIKLLNLHAENQNYERTCIGESIITRGLAKSWQYESLIDSGLSPNTDKIIEVYETAKYWLSFLSLEYPDSLIGTHRAHDRQLKILSYENWFDIPDELLNPGDTTIIEDIISPSFAEYSRFVFNRRAKVTALITALQVERYEKNTTSCQTV